MHQLFLNYPIIQYTQILPSFKSCSCSSATINIYKFLKIAYIYTTIFLSKYLPTSLCPISPQLLSFVITLHRLLFPSSVGYLFTFPISEIMQIDNLLNLDLHYNPYLSQVHNDYTCTHDLIVSNHT